MNDNYDDVVQEDELSEEESFEDDRDVPPINMVSEDGIAYDPNVGLDEVEEVESEVSELEPFRIDENMPQELKDQLIRFNKTSQSFYEVAVGGLPVVEETSDDIDEDEIDDSSDESTADSSLENDTIEENDIEVGNLF